jgi:hypothetical protein
VNIPDGATWKWRVTAIVHGLSVQLDLFSSERGKAHLVVDAFPVSVWRDLERQTIAQAQKTGILPRITKRKG